MRIRSHRRSANAWGPTNRIEVITASIVTDAHGGPPMLLWTYQAENVTASSEDPPRGGDRHKGTHSHSLSRTDDGDFLKGEYFNDRVRTDKTLGAGGYVLLRRVKGNFKNGLAFNANTWAMACPQVWNCKDEYR